MKITKAHVGRDVEFIGDGRLERGCVTEVQEDGFCTVRTFGSRYHEGGHWTFSPEHPRLRLVPTVEERLQAFTSYLETQGVQLPENAVAAFLKTEKTP